MCFTLVSVVSYHRQLVSDATIWNMTYWWC